MKSNIYIKAYNSPDFNKKEAFRYAGACEDESTLALVKSCMDDLLGKLSYMVCYTRYKIEVCEDTLNLGFTKVTSHSLATCLRDCHEIVLFAATVGGGIDRAIERASIISPAKAHMLQAIGSERVESLCDAFCNDLAEDEKRIGNLTRPRFSPGYGDLPLEIQRDIFNSLDLAIALGINLNDNLFMTPSKSVTAIVGIKKG